MFSNLWDREGLSGQGSLCSPGPQISTCFHQNISDNSHGCFALSWSLDWPGVVDRKFNCRIIFQCQDRSPSCLAAVMLTLTKDKRFWIRRWAGLSGIILMIHDLPIYLRENNSTPIKGLQSPWYKMCGSIDFWLFKFHSILTRFEWGPIWEWQSGT